MLSQEVRALIGDGNQAYIDGDVAEAIRVMQRAAAIPKNPRVNYHDQASGFIVQPSNPS